MKRALTTSSVFIFLVTCALSNAFADPIQFSRDHEETFAFCTKQVVMASLESGPYSNIDKANEYRTKLEKMTNKDDIEVTKILAWVHLVNAHRALDMAYKFPYLTAAQKQHIAEEVRQLNANIEGFGKNAFGLNKDETFKQYSFTRNTLDLAAESCYKQVLK